MTDKEINELLKIIERYKKTLLGNEKASKEFLVKSGIYTEKGNLRKNYKHLCIQPDRV